MIPTEYIEERGGGYYVTGSRVSLASVIFEFSNGASPETIRQNFLSLSLAQIYGAIAVYLNHPVEPEAYLQSLAERWKALERMGQQPSEKLKTKVAQAARRHTRP